MAPSEKASKCSGTSVDRQEGANSVPQGVGVTRKKGRGCTADLSINILCAAIQTRPHTHTHRIS